MSSIRITSLTFEHHPTGFGIGHTKPRLSWRFCPGDDGLKNWVQESCEIQIGQSSSKQSTTYHTQGSQSVLVPWPGPPLLSRECVWVNVRAHGKAINLDGKIIVASTEWSDTAIVEAALLDRNHWTAKLTVSSLLSSSNTAIQPLLFRRHFSFPAYDAKISKARLYITAHGVYIAYANGYRISAEEMAPGWTSYSHRLAYQTFDVTSMLAVDTANVIGVEVAEGWFAGRLGSQQKRRIWGSRLGFLAQLEVIFENDQSYTLTSDSTWKSCESAVTRSEIYDGEDYDSRLEQKGWNSDPSFDDSSWAATEETTLTSAILFASESPPVRVTEKIKPLAIFKSKSGKTLVDFGQNIAGKLEVLLPRPLDQSDPDGHKLSFSHAEVLEHSELGVRPLRTAKPIDTVVLSPGQPETWSPKFTFHGFRYVQVDGWPAGSGIPSSDDLTALVLHSDMARTGWFTCSDALINQLHKNAVWSMRGNTISIPTDCPQRDERLGWTGDIQLFTPSGSFLYDMNGFLGSWLADVAVEQSEDRRKGVPGVVVPDVFDTPPPVADPQCAWHDVTVLTPWDMYVSSGDTEVLRKQYASMKAWVDQGIPRGSNALWDQNAWQFGDWLDPSAPPEEPGKAATDSIMVADAYLVRVTETIAKASSLLGEAEDARHYSEQAAKIKAAFQHEYVTPAGLLAGDTQSSHALAIAFGVFDRKDQVVKSASRLEHLVHAARYRIATGFVGTPVILHALSNTGQHQLAYRMLLEKQCPSWLYPIKMGATTIWERWDSILPDKSINPSSMTSFNHYAFGSVVDWLHKSVGGISPLEPGWRKIKVRPVPGGTLTSAEATYDSPYGRIVSSWMIDGKDGQFHLTVTIPPNSTAAVTLPSQWNNAAQNEEKGVEIGSGTHQFSCFFEQDPWPPKAELRRSNGRLHID